LNSDKKKIIICTSVFREMAMPLSQIKLGKVSVILD
jgi:hypothetical protein